MYQHNHIGSSISNAFSILIEASFFLGLLNGHSITKNGHWIHAKVDYSEIYNATPKRIDRWRLKRMFKKQKRILKRRS